MNENFHWLPLIIVERKKKRVKPFFSGFVNAPHTHIAHTHTHRSTKSNEGVTLFLIIDGGL